MAGSWILIFVGSFEALTLNQRNYAQELEMYQEGGVLTKSCHPL